MLTATSRSLRHRRIFGATSRAPFFGQTTDPETDSNLVSDYLTGHESAFVEIMVRYREKIFGCIFALLRNYADAEEVTEDTFIRAHRGLAKFRGNSSLAMWLYRIAVNLSRSRYGYFFSRPRRGSLALNGARSRRAEAMLVDLLADDAANPVQQPATPEFVFLVDRCIEMLSAPHREILTLRNCFHRSYDEIGALLGINAAAVKSRMARARMELRILVGKLSSTITHRGFTYGFSRGDPSSKTSPTTEVRQILVPAVLR